MATDNAARDGSPASITAAAWAEAPGEDSLHLRAVHPHDALDSAHSERYRYFVLWRNNIKFMRSFMTITKALADETRVRTLLALREGELCVCQITELFGLAPSTMSKHLSILFQAGLVESRKHGRWIYYQLPAGNAPVEVREAIDWVRKSLHENPLAVQDRQSIKRILRRNPTELCRSQAHR